MVPLDVGILGQFVFHIGGQHFLQAAEARIPIRMPVQSIMWMIM